MYLSISQEKHTNCFGIPEKQGKNDLKIDRWSGIIKSWCVLRCPWLIVGINVHVMWRNHVAPFGNIQRQVKKTKKKIDDVNGISHLPPTPSIILVHCPYWGSATFQFELHLVAKIPNPVLFYLRYLLSSYSSLNVKICGAVAFELLFIKLLVNVTRSYNFMGEHQR